MDSSQSLDEKIKIDNSLSNRYIDLDPNGYFIIKVDLEENKIILEHFLNNINECSKIILFSSKSTFIIK